MCRRSAQPPHEERAKPTTETLTPSIVAVIPIIALQVLLQQAGATIATGAPAGAAGPFDPADVERARANVMAVDFGTFKSQVLAFLPPDEHPRYDSASVWDTIVLEVVEALEGGRP